MNRIIALASLVAGCSIFFATAVAWATPIDRHAVVARHAVVITTPNSRYPLQVGNGGFAFGADVTGLQTFYGNTMSDWGWHSFPLPPGEHIDDLKFTPYNVYGRTVRYATHMPPGQKELYMWLRENPHKMDLAKVSLVIDKPNGKPLTLKDLSHITQRLDLWYGNVTCNYIVEGQKVTVQTCCAPDSDTVAVRLQSPLIRMGKLHVEFAFPYGSPNPSGADWTKPNAYRTIKTIENANTVDFLEKLDADSYAVRLAWGGKATLAHPNQPHTFLLNPAPASDTLEFTCHFSSKPDKLVLPNYDQISAASIEHWHQFWMTGGAIDLSASKDPRWKELERRIVLSEYLMAVQEAGSLPPQETGLVHNSWYGKFHLEMDWWHGVHFALWGRWPLFARSLGWYHKILPAALELAKSQGYKGTRWPKMVGPEGRDSPSDTGPLLIWQQPHLMYYANLDYRLHPSREVLEKWKDIVFDTADFLASYAVLDKKTGYYNLGPPLKTVPENTNPLLTINPTFELSYWRFGLRIAQEWREKLGMPRNPQWDQVLNHLAPLPQQDGVYLMQQGMTDTYTKYNWEHPSLIGMKGMLPGDGVDPTVMKATVQKVFKDWNWNHQCWGWDFPMMAMGAARNGFPKMAVDALLYPANQNYYSINGFEKGGPYFPANGGLLTAVAMMAAGWDGCPNRNAPGFPDDGSWVVKWEGLKKMP